MKDVMRYSHCFLLASAIATGVVGCSSDQPTTTPASPSVPGAPTVSNAQVLVAGYAIQGRVAAGTGEPSLFRVHVDGPGGPSTIQRVVLNYSQPGSNHHGGRMMGGFSGTAFFYDDGTHGDDVPGDGIYHFMDPDEDIGCHGIEAPLGEYHYEFWCEDDFGQRSNVAAVTIVRE